MNLFFIGFFDDDDETTKKPSETPVVAEIVTQAAVVQPIKTVTEKAQAAPAVVSNIIENANPANNEVDSANKNTATGTFESQFKVQSRVLKIKRFKKITHKKVPKTKLEISVTAIQT